MTTILGRFPCSSTPGQDSSYTTTDARRTPWGQTEYRTCIRQRLAELKNQERQTGRLQVLLACDMQGKTKQQRATMTGVSCGGLLGSTNSNRRSASSQIAKGGA